MFNFIHFTLVKGSNPEHYLPPCLMKPNSPDVAALIRVFKLASSEHLIKGLLLDLLTEKELTSVHAGFAPPHSYLRLHRILRFNGLQV
jgi:hypothetical protein